MRHMIILGNIFIIGMITAVIDIPSFLELYRLAGKFPRMRNIIIMRKIVKKASSN